ncbi:MAG: hypothetical protein GY725_08850 [bacterium]|nr:hypothetical protein [bacterium]
MIARADLYRRVWEPMERLGIEFEQTYLDGSPHIHRGRCMLASATKPS